MMYQQIHIKTGRNLGIVSEQKKNSILAHPSVKKTYRFIPVQEPAGEKDAIQIAENQEQPTQKKKKNIAEDLQ